MPTSLTTRLVAALCAAALLCGTPPLRAQHNLPALGDTDSEDFSISTERKVGEQIMREIRRDPDYLDDPLLLEYLQSIWVPLVTQARASGSITADLDPRFAWEAFLVRDRSVNAFALPGGYVGVHLGLIAMTSTRDELAAVLAHELSHVTQRHIARGIANSKRQSLLGLAATIIGLLLASRSGSGDAANAAIVGGQAATIQGQLNFSRDVEREADRMGFAVLTGAGFAAGGMVSMFEKLDQASRLNDSGNFPYLRSHPLTTERIGEARARSSLAVPGRPFGQTSVSPLEHTLAAARARVLMDTRVDALRRWQALDAERSDAPVAQRLANATSSALASSLLRDFDRAGAALAQADALVAGNPLRDARVTRALALLKAQNQLARGDPQGASDALQPYAGEGTRVAALAVGEVALAASAGDTVLKRSADELQTRVASRPDDATCWRLLARIWARLNQPLRSLRAEAEAQVAIGDLPGALERLRAGQRLARSSGSTDFIEASVIDARARDVLAQIRQRQAEEHRP